MALNSTELRILRDLIARLSKDKKRRPRVLFLGYPDIFAGANSLQMVGIDVDWEALPKRPRERSQKVWTEHGRPDLADRPMAEIRPLIAALGGDAVVTDAIAWGDEDFILDLNERIGRLQRWRLGQFDLIVDPGTLEHCFNIAQAFGNVHKMLAPSGFVYHQSAIAFPNHGFWSISPTTFLDFYQLHGYQLGQPKRWNGGLDAEGFVIRLAQMDPFAPIVGLSSPIIGSFVFRKSALPIPTSMRTYPIQRCYSGLSRELDLQQFTNGTAEL